VRRNYISYMRTRTGKSARMTGLDFDKRSTNDIPEQAPEAVADDTADMPVAEATDSAK